MNSSTCAFSRICLFGNGHLIQDDIAGNSFDRQFPCRIDRQHYHFICEVEALCKFLRKVARASEQVRLEDHGALLARKSFLAPLIRALSSSG